MWLSHILHIVAFFAYFSKVSISHIFFWINGHFRWQFQYSMFFYLKQYSLWSENGRRFASWTWRSRCRWHQILLLTYVRFIEYISPHFLPHIWCLYGQHIFKCHVKLASLIDLLSDGLAKTCRDSRCLDTGNWRWDSSAAHTSRTLDDQHDRARPWPADHLMLIITTARGL